MKIGIFTGDHQENETGIGNYILNLISEIKKTPNELSIIRNQKGYNYLINSQIIPKAPYNSGLMVWSCFVSLQKQMLSDLDIVHSPTMTLFPIKPHENYVLTVHDIVFKKFPQYLPKGTIHHTKLFFKKNLKLSDQIIAVSSSTKKDLMKYYNIDEKKISVIPEAADNMYHPLSDYDINKIRQKYLLNNPFILYVGTIEPRKNIITILEAYATLKKHYSSIDLVIAGKKGWYFTEVFQKLQELKLEKSVKFLGYVPLSDLPDLYNAAEIFVYPSIYEGFGLPPLEAMQCGTPVITSNVSSLPEVVGDKGIMIDPTNSMALYNTMKRIIQDRSFREEIIEYGLERAKEFSWKKTAEMTLDVYEKVIGK